MYPRRSPLTTAVASKPGQTCPATVHPACRRRSTGHVRAATCESPEQSAATRSACPFRVSMPSRTRCAGRRVCTLRSVCALPQPSTDGPKLSSAENARSDFGPARAFLPLLLPNVRPTINGRPARLPADGCLLVVCDAGSNSPSMQRHGEYRQLYWEPGPRHGTDFRTGSCSTGASPPWLLLLLSCFRDDLG